MIEVQHLTKEFNGTPVLRGIDFRVKEGEIFGYLGPNGAGKTTTMRIILGLLRPTSGRALVFGKELDCNDDLRRIVGVLLEKDGLYERLSAYENLDYYAQLYSVSDVEEKIKSLLIRRLERYTSKITALIFSGIAMALLGIANFAFPDPIILADEILLLVGGTIISALAFWARRDALPAYKDRVDAQLRVINRVKPEPDPFLTRIYRTLCEKAEPSEEEAEDRIDAESRWLYRYVDIGEIIDKGECTLKDIAAFLNNLQDVLPLKRMAKMESGGSSPMKNRRFRERISLRTGFSDDALIVYGEFYKSLETYLGEKGERGGKGQGV